MSSEIKEISIDDLKAGKKNAIAMGPFGSRIKKESFTDSGIPVIKGGNLNGDFILEDEFDYLTVEKADELSTSNAFRRDIVITHRGTIGQVGIIPDNSKYERYVVSQSQLKVSLDESRVNPFFVYYFLRSPIGQHRLLSNASQVGVPAIAQASTSVKSILIPVPDLNVQNEIVEILLNLDNKIEANKQTNETLEAMAQAIFKSWFVDFDPVRTKIEATSAGRDPNRAAMAAIAGVSLKQDWDAIEAALQQKLGRMSDEKQAQLCQTAELFPDELMESEIGEVPRGWGVKPFYDTIEIIGGGTPKTKIEEYWGGDMLWYSVVDAPNESDVFVIDTEKKITKAGLENSSTKLVDAGTTIISARGTVGRLAMTPKAMTYNQSCYGLRSKIDCPYFNFYKTKQLVESLKRGSHGSVFDTITQKTFKTIDIVQPQENLEKRFDEVIGSLMIKIQRNSEENITLSKLRDTLLPKLISGEVGV